MTHLAHRLAQTGAIKAMPSRKRSPLLGSFLSLLGWAVLGVLVWVAVG